MAEIVTPQSGRRRRATGMHPSLHGPDADSMLSVRIRGLNHVFGQGELAKQVLFDNFLELTRGEIVIMTGPSGSGKTTLLTLVGALRTVQTGSVQIMGRELRGLSKRQLVDVRKDIGFIFQAHNLFESLTAFQNVRMAMELSDHSEAEMRARAEELLTTLGLGERIHYKPDKMSGGQKQRVAIARALVNRPSIILADEPTAALDAKSGRIVMELFKKFSKEERCTILVVTHDKRVIDAADRIVNMEDGKVKSNVVVMEAAAICEFLLKCSVFAHLSPTTLTEIADMMHFEKHPVGMEVIREGDEGDKFYVIRDGAAEVIINEGRTRKIVATLGPGDFFGETALLRGEPRNATVRALRELELYTLNKEDFESVMQSSTTFKDQLLKSLFARQ